MSESSLREALQILHELKQKAEEIEAKKLQTIILTDDDYYELRASIGTDGIVDVDRILRKRGYKLLFRKDDRFLEATDMW